MAGNENYYEYGGETYLTLKQSADYMHISPASLRSLLIRLAGTEDQADTYDLPGRRPKYMKKTDLDRLRTPRKVDVSLLSDEDDVE